MNWWETGFVAVEANRLKVAGRDAAELAARYGTPLYIYGKDRILELYARLDDAFARHTGRETRICYAMKANPHKGILRLLRARGAWIDAVSPCEVETALKAGFPAERILYTGTSVSRTDLRYVFGIKGLTVNIDAAEQLAVMGEVKREFPDRSIRVSVRWNPGVGRGFHAKAITAGKRSSDGTPIKFGEPPYANTNQFLTNLMADKDNCGSCGIKCPDGQCIMGSCSAAQLPAVRCAGFAIQCNGTCANILLDARNCGSCGNSCGSARSCCSGTCTDLQRDHENCGSCGRACGTDQTCCSGTCVDTSSSRSNCGECSHECPAHYSCSRGGCIATETDERNCGGRDMACRYDEECCGSACVNTAVDINNCGECGHICFGETLTCYNGECVGTTEDEYNCGGHNIVCGPNENCCGSACVNMSADDNNCGSCGSTCVNDAKCCSGTCRFLERSEDNCGACGVTCGDNQRCCDGTCVSISNSHCGSCYHSCGACETCSGGSCETTFWSVIGCLSWGF